MRNLLQYPVTAPEIIDFLKSSPTCEICPIKYEPQIGNLKGVIRNILINYYEQHPEELTKIVSISAIEHSNTY